MENQSVGNMGIASTDAGGRNTGEKVRRLYGVGGWLALLVFSLTVGCLLGMVRGLGTFVEMETKFPELLSYGRYEVYKTLCWGLIWILAVANFSAGYALCRIRRWSSVRWTIGVMWGTAAAMVICILALNAWFVGELSKGVTLEAIQTGFTSIVLAVLWTAYLLRSWRVENTYARLGDAAGQPTSPSSPLPATDASADTPKAARTGSPLSRVAIVTGVTMAVIGVITIVSARGHFGRMEWAEVAQGAGGSVWQVQDDSFYYGVDSNGLPAAFLQVRTRGDATGQMADERWSVSLAEQPCASGVAGKARVYDSAGFQREEAFAAKGQDAASRIVERFCALFDEKTKDSVEALRESERRAGGTSAGVRAGVTIPADSAPATAPVWVPTPFLQARSGLRVEVAEGSLRHMLDRGGNPAIVAQLRVANGLGGTLVDGYWYVASKDCATGNGMLVIADDQGNSHWETDFGERASNPFSGVGSFLCYSLKASQEESH